ncbi:MAG: hypothetical protein HYV07_04620 [Deltaproteobacteria bacterium]|nr:hypothetical protein [Deltaproteobacteria bacterium]
MRNVLLGFFVACLLASPTFAEDHAPISQGRYITAGVVSIFFSLGIGHAVAGEWTSTGWVFTLGETDESRESIPCYASQNGPQGRTIE